MFNFTNTFIVNSVEALKKFLKPFDKTKSTIAYTKAVAVDPVNGDVYIADAIDYQQQGMVLRYSSDGKELDRFYVGIIPGAFCWK